MADKPWGGVFEEATDRRVEEFTESLIRLVGENGMDWMYSNCSATAQRGALEKG